MSRSPFSLRLRGTQAATALAIATKLPAVLPVKAAGGVAIDAAINEYLHLPTGKAAHKDWRRHTLQSYTQSLKLFRVSCTKTFLREIDVDDLRTFKIHLRAQRTSTGKKIEPRTTYNHFLNVISFLNSYGRRDIIPQSEWPVYEEKKVVAYDPDAMHRLLQFADNDEADVIEFFLGIGFRNGEGTHLEWVDIDLKNREVHTYSKQAKYGWKVKDCEERIIGISDNLVSRLAARHQRHPGNGLVFANTKGKPDKHLLRIIKRVALRAKLNCGLCIAGALIPAALVVVRTQNFRPSRTSLC